MNYVVFTDYMDVFFMKIHVFPRCKKSFLMGSNQDNFTKEGKLKINENSIYFGKISHYIRMPAQESWKYHTLYHINLPYTVFKILRLDLEMINFFLYSMRGFKILVHWKHVYLRIIICRYDNLVTFDLTGRAYCKLKIIRIFLLISIKQHDIINTDRQQNKRK